MGGAGVRLRHDGAGLAKKDKGKCLDGLGRIAGSWRRDLPVLAPDSRQACGYLLWRIGITI